VHMGSFGPGQRYKDVRCFLSKRQCSSCLYVHVNKPAGMLESMP